MRLRRKLSDLSADNNLLTQNFLMVQSRYREVATARDDERRAQEIEMERVREVSESKLSATRTALTSILRSELLVLEATIKAKREAASRAALHGVLRSRYRTRLSNVIALWLVGVHGLASAEAYHLERSVADSTEEVKALLLSRQSDAIRYVLLTSEGRRDLSLLMHAMRLWKAGVMYVAQSKISDTLDAVLREGEEAKVKAEGIVNERDGLLNAERMHSAALTQEVHDLAERARAGEKELQLAQRNNFSLTREKDAQAAKLAEVELQLQLTKSQLEQSVEDRRRAEESKDRLQLERDQFFSELREAESDAKVQAAEADARVREAEAEAKIMEGRLENATTESKRESNGGGGGGSTSTTPFGGPWSPPGSSGYGGQGIMSALPPQYHPARLLAEATELRKRLAHVDAARERERQQLASVSAACAHLQGQLTAQKATAAELLSQEQRREITSQHQAQMRADMQMDAQLAFAGEILAFAKNFDVDVRQMR